MLVCAAGRCHHLKGLHPEYAGSSGVRPVAWFRFYDADESAAATLRLGSSSKVVVLASPHSYVDLPGGVMPAAASTHWIAVLMWNGEPSQSSTSCV
jgi:hypothetical protein